MISVDETRTAIVQFPHPGAEHQPGDAVRQPWNRGLHGRKFLVSPGRYVDGPGEEKTANIVFWGEWEAPSLIEDRWPYAGRLPCYLHRPVWERPRDRDARQNTDPWVFGDQFRYSNCRQLTYRSNPSALQSLAPGSIILFGSKLDRQFVLDTVFVVRDRRPYSPRDASTLDVDESFRICTVESLVTTGSGGDSFTLYRGATLEAPINGMFSFVPAMFAGEADPRFARPAIELPGYVNPASAQAASGAGTTVEPTVIHEQWCRVRDQVLAAGCVLGVHLDTPVRTDSAG
ncbi:MAG: hypothetical protein GEU80_16695 [Dehalococcoidia bacterium]|nr:hypothetical protein [Dehalococcoidia bacterium]